MNPPVFQVVGYKNSGKTHLIRRLVSSFKQMGLVVAVIKHDMHGFDIDHEGTDTFAIRNAGASAVAIASPWRTAIMYEQSMELGRLIETFKEYDVIIIEGYKEMDYPKLVMVRTLEELESLTALPNIIGFVSKVELASLDDYIQKEPRSNSNILSWLHSDDTQGIMNLIQSTLDL
ncbi:molybdopterin-guanine dinucleotide biosynthesis protein B [Paenibacillus shirakamiensis]|uniref:Molybdopterin-guanine dinucleotide biosynthesis protein B n=1 Tax=Paenibacillus shirakamiensis TaxID=1265935 RepID=A0ABS4JDS1_9BACL|nr:molybdopterin-guanine dinucleotide biosynthesis protein B [Paenibacillus shirakamiensis]MBP1999843.1 molybdopterin-guanine dinucleotide biosynthesis protein B [Paenibacillus shirakamiensis]